MQCQPKNAETNFETVIIFVCVCMLWIVEARYVVCLFCRNVLIFCASFCTAKHSKQTNIFDFKHLLLVEKCTHIAESGGRENGAPSIHRRGFQGIANSGWRIIWTFWLWCTHSSSIRPQRRVSFFLLFLHFFPGFRLLYSNFVKMHVCVYRSLVLANFYDWPLRIRLECK